MNLIACTLVIAALPSLATAQQEVIVIDGAAQEGLQSLAIGGDYDSDGLRDLVIGGVNLVRVVSTSTWIPIYHIDAPHVGIVGNAGDFDGDGIVDFLAGGKSDSTAAFGAGKAVVFSGATGLEIVEILGDPISDGQFGRQVQGIGDVNNDGFDDVLIAASWWVSVRLGPDGTELRSHLGPGSRPSIGSVGDVDFDGIPDYIVGWPQDSTTGVWAGAANVYSGVDGSVIHTVHGVTGHAHPSSTGDHLGLTVAGAGDVNLDGVPDFAAGAPGELDPIFGCGRGFVRVYSGLDASVLLHVPGPDDDLASFGRPLAGGGDVNGDGVPDLVTGARCDAANHGSTSVISGSTGAILWKRFGTVVGERWPYDVLILDDITGDGVSEWADAVGGNPLFFSYRVRVHEGAPGDAQSVCITSPNSVGPGALIGYEGSISVGNANTRLTVHGAAPNQPGLFYYGSQATQVPFGNGIRCIVAQNGVNRLFPIAFADAAGYATLPINFTSGPAAAGRGQWLPGGAWYLQYWYRDPSAGGAGFNLSDALSVILTP